MKINAVGNSGFERARIERIERLTKDLAPPLDQAERVAEFQQLKANYLDNTSQGPPVKPEYNFGVNSADAAEQRARLAMEQGYSYWANTEKINDAIGNYFRRQASDTIPQAQNQMPAHPLSATIGPAKKGDASFPDILRREKPAGGRSHPYRPPGPDSITIGQLQTDPEQLLKAGHEGLDVAGMPLQLTSDGELESSSKMNVDSLIHYLANRFDIGVNAAVYSDSEAQLHVRFTVGNSFKMPDLPDVVYSARAEPGDTTPAVS